MFEKKSYNPTGLLKVVSIIVIILSIVAVISGLLTCINLNASPEVSELMKTSGVTMQNLVISMVLSAVQGICAFIARSGKNKMNASIAAIIILVCTLGSMIMGIMQVGFKPLTLINLVIPLLILWGVYQSE